ncbi:hypothetical protein LITTLEE_20 [Mycobacterium phage LittleE]|uniref:Uncharacterized protein n=1 Tax=Mycobacterium phage LittleE TaxID=2922212 RepID=G1D3Q5_9CAUD|nr:hypothetical protein FGG27_gp020 [Mycobacterium phage LittleE]AEK09614.1 hypothetical protein LITTLEE_20 [Mycobacterium phage LittleE]ASD53413.1 hypothetical protein PBI_LUCKY2013_20 [Mycobacterium phage Lucky2013]QPO16839.1 hypothetical protein SEA_KASHFLOW_14 [Mycobacterium phage KashFlow]
MGRIGSVVRFIAAGGTSLGVVAELARCEVLSFSGRRTERGSVRRP